ncbi:hypothetical protein RAS1_01250 [Phycisphaerae bacterium RAS1]|nr:hypothetical protein RAS1_01250 [Phycisphaerae bacterium RAS1]
MLRPKRFLAITVMLLTPLASASVYKWSPTSGYGWDSCDNWKPIGSPQNCVPQASEDVALILPVLESTQIVLKSVTIDTLSIEADTDVTGDDQTVSVRLFYVAGTASRDTVVTVDDGVIVTFPHTPPEPPDNP